MLAREKREYFIHDRTQVYAGIKGKNELIAVENGNYRRGVDQRGRPNVYILQRSLNKKRETYDIFFFTLPSCASNSSS